MKTETITERERRELGELAATLARDHFIVQGRNCPEATLRAVLETLNLPLDDLLKRAATPFGGGIGHTRSTCGALVGAEMALGTVVGRLDANQEHKLWAYGHAARLHDAFMAEAGGEYCRDLNEPGFDRPDLKAFCSRYVEIAARLAVQQILEAQAESPS